MSDCLFCKLIEEKKLKLLYEDDQVVAFPDIDPKAETHILIVPKQHIGSVAAIEPDDETVLGHLFSVARSLAAQTGAEQSGYRLVVNTGQNAGQTVFHIHMHLLGGQPLGEMTTT